MATKEAAVKAKLVAGTGWTTLVTGGTFNYEDLGRTGLTPDTAAAQVPSCYDANGLLKLTAVLTWDTSNQKEIVRTSERQFFHLWLYHDSSYALIRQAVQLAIKTLHRVQVTADDQGLCMMHWVDRKPEAVADEMGGALMGGARFYMDFTRK